MGAESSASQKFDPDRHFLASFNPIDREGREFLHEQFSHAVYNSRTNSRLGSSRENHG